MNNILIIGATSAIATAAARQYADDGDALFLLGRNAEQLDAIAADLQIRGASQVSTSTLDVNDFSKHEAVISSAFEEMKTIDVVLIAHGTLPNQEDCEQSAELSLQEINTNGLSTISLLTTIANKMEVQHYGSIAVITSVAGDRGRQSNYVYGAAKSLVSTFLQGLAQRLHKSGVHVLDVKPGFVDTPMTKDFKKGALWAKPDAVAKTIKKRIKKRSNFSYVPVFWFVIMFIIVKIPTFIFKKISL